ASAEDGLAVAGDVPGEAHAGSKVVLVGIKDPVGVFSELSESGTGNEVRQPVIAFREGRHVLVAESQVYHQPGHNAPVVLEESRERLGLEVAPGISDENLPVAAGQPSHEILHGGKGNAAKG